MDGLDELEATQEGKLKPYGDRDALFGATSCVLCFITVLFARHQETQLTS